MVLLLVVAGCRQDMRNQPRVKPLAPSTFFADGRGARPVQPNTIARGHLRLDPLYFEGKDGDKFTDTLPVPVTPELLKRGQERYGIYCTPCHDRVGTGRGIVVRRGYKAPPSYHDPRLRSQPVGYFYDVIAHGFGVMPDYAAQIAVADRWAIAAYIRVLQFSQCAEASALSAEDLEQVAAAATAAAPPAAPTTSVHHE